MLGRVLELLVKVRLTHTKCWYKTRKVLQGKGSFGTWHQVLQVLELLVPGEGVLVQEKTSVSIWYNFEF